MKYHFKIHKEGAGFWAECLELPGCLTQADTMEELHENMQEALNLYIEEPENSKQLANLPDESISPARNIVEVPLDPLIACAFMVRHSRLQRGLTQKQAARKLGFDNVFSYQRLESKRCNPRLDTLLEIKKVFPEFSVDAAISF